MGGETYRLDDPQTFRTELRDIKNEMIRRGIRGPEGYWCNLHSKLTGLGAVSYEVVHSTIKPELQQDSRRAYEMAWEALEDNLAGIHRVQVSDRRKQFCDRMSKICKDWLPLEMKENFAAMQSKRWKMKKASAPISPRSKSTITMRFSSCYDEEPSTEHRRSDCRNRMNLFGVRCSANRSQRRPRSSSPTPLSVTPRRPIIEWQSGWFKISLTVWA